MKPQHYQVSLIEAIFHYQRGDLTAKGLLHFYIKIRLKAGWKLKETQKEISQKLGISRAAFYSALSKLKAEGSINWSAPVNTRFCITLNSGESINLDDESTDEDDSLSSTTVDGVSTISNNSSTVADGQSTHQDDSSTVVDSPSYIVTGEKPETILRKDLRKLSYSSPYSSSDSFSNSFSTLSSDIEREENSFKEKGQDRTRGNCAVAIAQIPSKTLSEATRERNLLLWGKFDGGTQSQIRYYAHQVALPKLPIKPTLPDAWITCHCEELFNQMMRDTQFQKQWEEFSANSPAVENEDAVDW